MAEVQARVPFILEFLPDATTGTAVTATREARERALAAGQTVTTYKDGRLVQEKMVGGKLIELFNQTRERDSD